MSDLIERQAAIDALDKRFDSIPMKHTTEILLLRKDLRDLPSAKPEPCGDAVSRAKLQERLQWIIEHGLRSSNGKHSISAECVLEYVNEMPSAQPEPQWIPCSESLPEEDYWLGGSGRQFSDNVLISILNSDDEDAWVDISHTIDGEWALELPRHCQIVAWMPLPEPYTERREG